MCRCSCEQLKAAETEVMCSVWEMHKRPCRDLSLLILTFKSQPLVLVRGVKWVLMRLSLLSYLSEPPEHLSQSLWLQDGDVSKDSRGKGDRLEAVEAWVAKEEYTEKERGCMHFYISDIKESGNMRKKTARKSLKEESHTWENWKTSYTEWIEHCTALVCWRLHITTSACSACTIHVDLIYQRFPFRS